MPKVTVEFDMEIHGHEIRQLIGGVETLLRRVDLLIRLQYESMKKGDKLMAAIDDFKAALVNVQTELDAVANDVTRVVGILQNAGSNDPAIVDATNQLNAIADKLKSMDSAIDAVSPDAPPAPTPAP